MLHSAVMVASSFLVTLVDTGDMQVAMGWPI
jgi:hypothetical protein